MKEEKKTLETEERTTEKKKILPKIGITFLLIILGIYSYMKFIEPKQLKIKEYAIINEEIPSNFEGIKIIQFGDIHFGNSTNEKETKKVIEKIIELKPDILVFTGDLFDPAINLTEANSNFLKEELKKTTAPLGKYAIKGDNDYLNITSFEDIFTGANFKILNNENIPIFYKGNTPIYISGIPSISKKEQDITKALEKENKNTYQILLTHEPIIFDEVKNETNLVLAGHTLGGLIRIPLIGGIIKQNNIGEYEEDHYQKGKSTMYITNGIGTEKTPLRLMNKPSISLYRLYQKE